MSAAGAPGPSSLHPVSVKPLPGNHCFHSGNWVPCFLCSGLGKSPWLLQYLVLCQPSPWPWIDYRRGFWGLCFSPYYQGKALLLLFPPSIDSRTPEVFCLSLLLLRAAVNGQNKANLTCQKLTAEVRIIALVDKKILPLQPCPPLLSITFAAEKNKAGVRVLVSWCLTSMEISPWQDSMLAPFTQKDPRDDLLKSLLGLGNVLKSSWAAFLKKCVLSKVSPEIHAEGHRFYIHYLTRSACINDATLYLQYPYCTWVHEYTDNASYW